MAEDRFQRFRHLERPRRAEAGARDATPGTEERFEALEERTAGVEGPAPVAGGHLDRFRPAAERPLDVVAEVAGELPFLRCAACQMDHNRSATTCTQCGADLRTEPQRAFNARLAEERRAQASVEAAQAAERDRAQQEAGAEEAKARREMGESLAREVGEAERRRLDAEGLGGWGSAPGRGGWGGGSGWDEPGWSGGWGWGRRRGPGLLGWLIALLVRALFGGRWR